MLPVLSRTLRTSEAASAATASGKRMGAALRRRARVAQKYAHTQEHGAVFKVSPGQSTQVSLLITFRMRHGTRAPREQVCTSHLLAPKGLHRVGFAARDMSSKRDSAYLFVLSSGSCCIPLQGQQAHTQRNIGTSVNSQRLAGMLWHLVTGWQT